MQIWINMQRGIINPASGAGSQGLKKLRSKEYRPEKRTMVESKSVKRVEEKIGIEQKS